MTRKALLTDNGYKGNSSTGPSDGVYAHVWAQGIDAGDPGGVNLFVEITYYAVFQGNNIAPLS